MLLGGLRAAGSEGVEKMDERTRRTGWQEMRNLFSRLKFGQKCKTKWHLTTWTDCAERTRARSELFTRLGTSGGRGRAPNRARDRQSQPLAAIDSTRFWVKSNKSATIYTTFPSVVQIV